MGTGKTTLINKLLSWLRQQRVATAFVFNSMMDVPQFLDYMMTDFGIPSSSRRRARLFCTSINWLLERYRAGENAVLIIDEAQNLSDEVLEEIRLMTNLETFTEKLLQIVLVGQPELDDKLRRPQLRQLRQRVMLRAKTQPSAAARNCSVHYTTAAHRGLEWPGDFYSRGAVGDSSLSHGIPRVVNLICEHCLINAFADQQHVVTGDGVKAVAHDFELEGNGSSVSLAAFFAGRA